MDYNLYRQAKELAEQLRPIAAAIDRAQSDSAGLADTCDIFLDLLEDQNLKPHQKEVEKRFKQAIQPCHLTAYMLHPAYQGKRLTTDQREVANNWLLQKNPEYLGTAIAFQSQDAPFPPSYFKATNLPPMTWWKALSFIALPTGFLDLMLQLHSASASSASIERIFSSFGLIHNKVRNRLGVEKATKLVFCYRMLRGRLELDF